MSRIPKDKHFQDVKFILERIKGLTLLEKVMLLICLKADIDAS